MAAERKEACGVSWGIYVSGAQRVILMDGHNRARTQHGWITALPQMNNYH